MRDGADRRPGAVPDDSVPDGGDGGPVVPEPADVHAGADTDGNGHPDTLLTSDGTDLLVLTDLDGDGLADRVLRIGPDGSVDGHGELRQIDAASDTPDTGTGSAPAHSSWSALLGHLFGSDP